MKRLVTMCVMAAALAVASPALAQSKEFTGSWTLDAEKSVTKDGPKVVIFAFSEKDFTVKFAADGPPMPFKLDGSETEHRSAKTKAAWKNNKLICTVTKGAAGTADGAPESITFSRDGAWLVMEGVSPQHGPMKFYFKKAPEKQ